MRSVILITTCLAVFHLAAQQSEPVVSPDYKGHCTAHFEKLKWSGPNDTQHISDFLKAYLPHLNNEHTDIRLLYRKVSPGGIHYSFIQTYKDITIYQSEIKVNTDNHQTIRSIFDNSAATDHWDLQIDRVSPQSVIALRDGEPLLAEKTLTDNYEMLTAGGELIYQRDVRSYFSYPDSLVWAKVFSPDPLTSAQQNYGGTYADHGDSTANWLDLELQTVSMMATFNGTAFNLSNAYIRLSDFDSPTIPPVTPATNHFFYNRSQSGFEDVNAFYHLNVYRQHVHDLGFSIADDSVEVDTHAFGGADQSAFVATHSPMRLYYGVGGVDDAEDADVLTHEYGHFLSYNAAPESNLGSERNSLDEAFGDYIAASYSKSISLYKSDWVFNWDGHNEFWNGRVVNSPKVYPNDLTSSIYKNAEIWSSALMAIHDDIGRNAMDSLLFETHYSYAANITMADAAELLIDADSVLNNGAYFCAIYQHLLEHGFVPFEPNNPCGINHVADASFADVIFRQDGRSFHLTGNNRQPVQLQLLNAQGQQIIPPMQIGRLPFSYQNSTLPNGYYLVLLLMDNQNLTFRWCKTE